MEARTLGLADLHLGHTNAYTFRNFSSSEEHDHTIVDNICSVITKKDTLILPGDFIFSMKALHLASAIIERAGTTRLIGGNHDNAEAVAELIRLHGNKFRVYGAFQFQDAWITHIPVHDSEFGRVNFNIHGHKHDFVIPDNRYINICCEQTGYVPVDLKELLNERRTSNSLL